MSIVELNKLNINKFNKKLDKILDELLDKYQKYELVNSVKRIVSILYDRLLNNKLQIGILDNNSLDNNSIFEMLKTIAIDIQILKSYSNPELIFDLHSKYQNNHISKKELSD